MLTVRSILAATLIISLFVPVQISYAKEDTKIAFTSLRGGGRDIYVVDGDVRNQTRLTVHPKDDYNPTWSPDGRRIAFVSNRNAGKSQIWAVGLDGKNPVKLTDGTRDDYPDWSPDGKKIVYQSHHSGARGVFVGQPRFEIYVIDSDGSNIRQLMGKDSIHPCWSPGGTRVIFSHSKDLDTYQIYSIDSDGENLKQLTYDNMYKRYPSFSRDGKKIAYTGKQHIWVMDSDGMNKKRVTKRKDFVDEHPTWSPDSKAIAFHAIRNQLDGLAIFVVDLSRNRAKLFIDIQGGSNLDADWHHPGPLSISPEDTKVTIWGRLKSRK